MITTARGRCGPDPVDFRAYRSVNISRRAQRLLLRRQSVEAHTQGPAIATPVDHLYSTFMDRNQVELARRRRRMDGPAASTTRGSRCSDQSVTTGTSSRSSTGTPARSIRRVAQYWKDHYDLREYHGARLGLLGPKLKGKIHITSGTMDNGYLNNAALYMEDFFKTAKDPTADAEVIWGDRRETSFTGDMSHPNWYGSRTVHQRYMPAMAAWMIKTAPPGADTRSWRY